LCGFFYSSCFIFFFSRFYVRLDFVSIFEFVQHPPYVVRALWCDTRGNGEVVGLENNTEKSQKKKIVGRESDVRKILGKNILNFYNR
jgi:hypothetical protein